MERNKHKEIVNNLLTMVSAENQAAASELLTQLTDDYNSVMDNADTLTASNATLTENNERLRKVNADLFLKVGNTIPDNKPNEPNEGEGNESELTFEALFNEKGELI